MKKHWNEKAPNYYNGVEPFNISDFNKVEEGFKENGIKEFLQTLTDSQFVSMYKVTRRDNPNKVKFLSWLEVELENRKLKR
ncbi:hypothetical protein PG326_10635 [Riemerella anatipestifer]|nr:hypothetical protein [Riemerella anatipestifer]MDY3358769.1 hypothetical protein [Riemerella anatipestifer]